MKVAVVGATGLVGTKMLQVLAERNFPVTELIPVASERSVGNEIEFKGKKYKVVSMTDAIAAKPAVAIFSAGGNTSLEWAPKFAEAGITVIVATTGAFVVFATANEAILPVPDAASPIEVALFVQLKLLPVTLLPKLTADVLAP